ncbi:NAD(P)/FAD-dependent oxidoreductase [Luteolibacter rhizosphaerae]|nr:NAD(P)/FAD-dependent oxidoreductase [Luteolibacter rhizosphaerae]
MSSDTSAPDSSRSTRRKMLKQVVCLTAASSMAPCSLATEQDGEIQADLVVIGGGPAGMQAALVAARARRQVLLIDGGTPRNAAAPALHTFVSRDGILPADFRRLGLAELLRYPTFRFGRGLVEAIKGEAGAFQLKLSGGKKVRARYVILALGLVDTLPDIPGLKENWGKGVHHCVFCDGYEQRDRAWGLLVKDLSALEHAPLFRGWTADLTVFTQGLPVPEADLARLGEQGVRVESRPIREIRGGSGDHRLAGLLLEDGTELPIETFWVAPDQRQPPLVESLGLDLREDGAVQRSETCETSKPGIFAAGDLSAGRMQQAILAAADGSRAAFSIIRELMVRSRA